MGSKQIVGRHRPGVVASTRYKSIRVEESMKKQAGFTLIELVMVIVILGILAASFAPKFLDVKTSAVEGVQEGAKGAVAGAITISLAKNKGTYPSVTALAAAVDGASAAGTTAADVGLYFDADSSATTESALLVGTGKEFRVTLFKESAPGVCDAAAAAVGDLVCAVQ